MPVSYTHLDVYKRQMQGGYNIHPLIDALDDAKLAPIAAKALSHTLLMFDNFYDVEEKAKAGNEYAKQVRCV